MDQPPQASEQERIRAVYHAWHGGAGLDAYAWHRPEILVQNAVQARVTVELLLRSVGPDLSSLNILDVGCGTGGFLRQLLGWGATPTRLTGTEFQQDRLDRARRTTAPGVHWHLGELDGIDDASQHLVVANTVFSSIIDGAARAALARGMWRTLRPGGWIMVFDMRYNNPRNPQVRRLTRCELAGLWPATASHYRSLLLAPPLGRRLARMPRLLPDLLESLVPPLRSHFLYTCRKG